MTVYTENVWSDYDGAVAQAQLDNFGVVFVDEYGYPIDDEFEQEEAFEAWKKRRIQ